MTGKIAGLIFNTFGADQKYCLLNRDNFTKQNELQFFVKIKTFCQLFFGIFEMYINL